MYLSSSLSLCLSFSLFVVGQVILSIISARIVNFGQECEILAFSGNFSSRLVRYHVILHVHHHGGHLVNLHVHQAHQFCKVYQ